MLGLTVADPLVRNGLPISCERIIEVPVHVSRTKRRRSRASARTQTPALAARTAGLRYVRDDAKGIRRIQAGRGFRYIGVNGKPIHDHRILKRIRTLAIPPAWTDVWICPSPRGHLQATGKDSRNRKQYRYHSDWRQIRDEAKYHLLIDFAKALPRIRSRVEKDLRRHGLPRSKVLAAVVRLLETTLIRVGNEEYARENHSFGLTTMRDSHVQKKGATVRFAFRGKGGIRHSIDLDDRRLARIIKQCRDIPGQELFQYWDEQGKHHAVNSTDVNDYLSEAAGQPCTAKVFRTWAGTVLAACALQEFKAFKSRTQARRNAVAAIKQVAERLGNTVAICRKCYIHPAVLEAHLQGDRIEGLQGLIKKRFPLSARLSSEERAGLRFLQRQLRSEK